MVDVAAPVRPFFGFVREGVKAGSVGIGQAVGSDEVPEVFLEPGATVFETVSGRQAGPGADEHLVGLFQLVSDRFDEVAG